MQTPLENIKDRITKKGGSQTELTSIMEMVRSFSCLGEIIGREFEVSDGDGNIVYTVRQKPMAIKQLNVLLKELNVMFKLDAEREAAKWGKKR